MADGSKLSSVAADPKAALPALIGRILGLDALIKGVLAQAEAAQRAAAVRETVKQLIPQLNEARSELIKDSGANYGPMVVYPAGMKSEATEMNKTALGSTVTIRRWHVAQ